MYHVLKQFCIEIRKRRLRSLLLLLLGKANVLEITRHRQGVYYAMYAGQ